LRYAVSVSVKKGMTAGDNGGVGVGLGGVQGSLAELVLDEQLGGAVADYKLESGNVTGARGSVVHRVPLLVLLEP